MPATCSSVSRPRASSSWTTVRSRSRTGRLIRQWPRLRGWLTEDRDELRARRQLAAAARAWDEAGRSDVTCSRGPRLAAAAGLRGRGLGRRAGVPRRERRAQQRELTDARRRARPPSAHCSRRSWSRFVAALLAGRSPSLSAVARGARPPWRRPATSPPSRARRRGQHPDLALLLALEGGRLDDSVDTRGALLGALGHGSRIRKWLHGFARRSRARRSARTGSSRRRSGRTARRSGTRRPGAAPRRRCARWGRWQGADFSPDGRTLAIAGGEGESSCGTWRRGRSCVSWPTRSPREIRRPRPLDSSSSAPTAPSWPPVRRRRTTSRSGRRRPAG